jgi:hypothetical protein
MYQDLKMTTTTMTMTTKMMTMNQKVAKVPVVTNKEGPLVHFLSWSVVRTIID